MAGKTYKTCGIVLRKTKLAEKDLIVTILDESGSIVRAVAKGARRPGGSYAARLELFSVVDLMLAQGRNLDVVTGATFTSGAKPIEFGIEQSACASVLAELLATVAQEELEHPRLFDMAQAAFSAMASAQPSSALSLACSATLKAFAYSGFRPSFTECVVCASPVSLEGPTGMVPFSVVEGGVACTSCTRPSDAVLADTSMLAWANVLMRSRFNDVMTYDPPVETLIEVLQLIRQWTQVHANKTLKSLDFLLTSGLF